jgi:hypothetical protein
MHQDPEAADGRGRQAGVEGADLGVADPAGGEFKRWRWWKRFYFITTYSLCLGKKLQVWLFSWKPRNG